MKAEWINTMQLFFILVFLIGIITYVISFLKKYILRFKYNFVKRIGTKYLDYSRFMIIQDYIPYEKYDIWRYCVRFYAK